MQIVIDIILLSSIYLIVSLSIAVIYNVAKFLQLSQAVIISFGAYFAYFFILKFHFSIYFSSIIAIFSCAMLGISTEIIIYKNMRKKNASSFIYLVASIGLYAILQNMIPIFFGNDTKIINTAKVAVGNQIFGAYITSIQAITILVSITLFITVNLFLNFTKTGKTIRAVASNPELCNIYGISSDKITLIAFGIGSALAATAGILSAMDTNMTPTFGFNLFLYGMVAMIIGGVGSTRGLVAGALLVGTAQHLAAYYIDTKWMDAVTYIILILFLIWRPLGFSGKRLRKVNV